MQKRSYNQSMLRKNLCMEDSGQNTERERERGTKSVYIHERAIVTNDNQPLQKVTKSPYIVTDLGQLPFMLFT